jgi:RimJ/RimL family protein N-acetyltransferase
MLNDRKTMAYLLNMCSFSVERVRERRLNFVRQQAARQRVQFHIHVRADAPASTFVGMCGVAGIDQENRHGDLGIILASERWGCGYAAEALRALIEQVAFGWLQLHRLTAQTRADNLPMRRLLDRLGFSHESTQKDQVYFEGVFFDTVCYVRFESAD